MHNIHISAAGGGAIVADNITIALSGRIAKVNIGSLKVLAKVVASGATMSKAAAQQAQ